MVKGRRRTIVGGRRDKKKRFTVGAEQQRPGPACSSLPGAVDPCTASAGDPIGGI